jgi:hypothetical protein
MKKLPPFSFDRRGYIIVVLNALLAIGLTVASLGFVRPVNCQRFCDAPRGIPCAPGACRNGEQRAGLPLPVLVDSSGGESPLSGWGKLGPEDVPNPVTFIFDVFFYGVLLTFAGYLITITRRREKPVERITIILPLAVVLLGLLGGLASYWPYLTR